MPSKIHSEQPPSQPTMHQLMGTSCDDENPQAVSNPVQSRLNFEQRTKTSIEMNQDAFPRESVALVDAAVAGDHAKARALYEWFLPLLRLDTVPKFVQYIKWVQEEMGCGSATVRPPRLPLDGAELANAKAVLRRALKTRPQV